jgi:hypothetical protein
VSGCDCVAVEKLFETMDESDKCTIILGRFAVCYTCKLSGIRFCWS